MNKVVHFEMPTDDFERAKKFYAEVFEWEMNTWPMQSGETYTGATTVATDPETMTPKEPGAINGALVPRSTTTNPTPIITLEVESIDDHLAKIETAGGKRLSERTEIPGMGAYAYFQDSEGNAVGLWETFKKA